MPLKKHLQADCLSREENVCCNVINIELDLVVLLRITKVCYIKISSNAAMKSIKTKNFENLLNTIKVKWSRYCPGVAQRVGRGIALLFHDRGTRRGWVVSSTPRPKLTLGKDPVPILQEAKWGPRTVWTGGKFRPHRDSIPNRPARRQSIKYYILCWKPCGCDVG